MSAPIAPPQARASASLAQELKKKVREHGIVAWLDTDGRYIGFASAIARGEHGFPYPVVSFQGSYLELMLALEKYGNEPLPEHLVLHLPGLNKDTVKETPALELYTAGSTFEKALPTLVREAAVGVARPEEIDAFLRSPPANIETADTWLASLRAAPRDALGILLDGLGADEVVQSLLADDGRLRAHLPDGAPTLLAYLEKAVGLTQEWRAFRAGDGTVTASTMASVLSSFVMAVEFVHDLKEAPVTPALLPLSQLGPFAKECRRHASRFRETQPDLYESFANELQELLKDERTSHHAGALGTIDTFRFEEATMRSATFGAIGRGEWDEAAAFADARTTERCFWVRRSPSLQRTWDVLRLAASTGKLLAATRRALERCNSLDEAVERYADKLAPVDRQHRLFEQRAHAVVASDLEDYDALLDVRRAVREAYRAWADAQNRGFFELCQKHGALPSRGLRQRHLFDDEVRPLVEGGGVTAFILVDAMRFEMAQALEADLRRERFQVTLRPKLAELPTETIVGMNALAPVQAAGRLRLVQKDGAPAGFRAGGLLVAQPKERVRTISDAVQSGAPVDLELEAFADMTLTQLKRTLQQKPALVVVRSRELDTAGEHGLHLGTFDQTLTLLRSAVLLLSQANVERFVITSDHGFLLQDPTTANVPFGVSKRTPQRRYALVSEPSGMPDVLELRLSSLEYDVEDDAYLVFRPDTALWQVKDKIAPFVHGGNSLQERVIPALIATRGVARGKTLTKYEVVARPEPAHLGRQRLRVAIRLQDRQNATLGFVAPKTISLALRVKMGGVLRSDIALMLLDAGPPATLSDGLVLVPPNREEALVEFELEGEVDEKVRVEIYHPDAKEDVAPKEVEGFFDVARNRRLGQGGSPTFGRIPSPSVPPEPLTDPDAAPPASERAPVVTIDPTWTDLIDDATYRQIFELVAQHQIVNEVEAEKMLGSARRVRAFSRAVDALAARLPFEVEIVTVSGLKAWKRRA